MAKIRVAINGFGRIGRAAFKIAEERTDLEVVAINDLAENQTLAQLLKHDSVYGEYEPTVEFDDESIAVDGRRIKVLAAKDPTNLPWQELGVDIVLECTGIFTDPAKAMAHLQAGAKKVILSAPAKGSGATTIVLGVNDDAVKTAGDVISCASCTTNCIAPVMSVLKDNFGVKKALMSTVHSYTSDQELLDGAHKDPRRARAAAINIVPTSTGASQAAAETIPELKDKFGGTSYRVPTPTVSICDIVALIDGQTDRDKLNQVFQKAATEPYYQGILDVTIEELVSSDFIGNSNSATVDLALTQVIDGDLVKIVAWYDNEWGYSNRLIELTADVGKGLGQ
jgi:glyceraldehyde 3-phosphate dehydrogenase